MEYNITKEYLTYAEIQNIVDQVVKSNVWSDRQQIIDMLMLCYCTDIGQDKIAEVGHERLLVDGVIDDVRGQVKNYYQIRQALQYTESTARAIMQLSTEFLPKLQKALKFPNNSTKKGKKG